MNIKKKESTNPTNWEEMEVEFREPTVEDTITAERISEATKGQAYTLALVSQICTFNGEKKLYEDLMDMPNFFLNEIFTNIIGMSKEELAELLLQFSEQDILGMKNL